MTVADLIDYLQQCPQDARVVVSKSEIDEPCGFVALDIAISDWNDMNDNPMFNTECE